jgi:predicted kinase
MKILLILRGVSYSGKSLLANYIQTICSEKYRVVVCSADDFFINKKGEYHFDAQKLGQAHGECKDKFYEACKANVELIIIANTNTKEGDFKSYDLIARGFGYQIFTLIVENRHGGINSHAVPKETLDRQEKNIRDSLKLR